MSNNTDRGRSTTAAHAGLDWRWPLADTASVLVFVTIGRINHAEGVTIGGVAMTALPFLIALVVAWLIPGVARSAISPTSGAVVWGVVVALGMVLRHWVFAEGTALPFIVVATVFLGFEFNGWRALARALVAAH